MVRTMSGPDYSHIDTPDKARQHSETGVLVPLLLMPEMFGGEPVRENVVYVPPFVADLKASHDQNVVVPLAQQGKITQYSAVPEYSGRSFVPVALQITASNPGAVRYRIEIWGDGLGRTGDD